LRIMGQALISGSRFPTNSKGNHQLSLIWLLRWRTLSILKMISSTTKHLSTKSNLASGKVFSYRSMHSSTLWACTVTNKLSYCVIQSAARLSSQSLLFTQMRKFSTGKHSLTLKRVITTCKTKVWPIKASAKESIRYQDPYLTCIW